MKTKKINNRVSKIIVLFLVFGLFQKVAGQEKFKLTLQEYELKGKVRSIKEFSYTALSKTGRQGKVVDINLFNGNTKISFNLKGKKTKEEFYSKNKKQKKVNLYKYDKLGNNTEINFNKKYTIQYVFDRKNRRVGENWCVGEKCKNEYEYRYLLNTLIEKAHKDGKKVDTKIVYSYGRDKKNILSETEINSSRKVNWKKLYKYNKQKKVSEKDKYDTWGGIEEKHIYKYNEDGDLSEKITHNRMYSPRFYGTVYEFDEKDNKVKEIHYQLTSRKKVVEGQGYWRSFNYSFDSQGNWIKCVVIQNTVPKYVIKRVIKYYK